MIVSFDFPELNTFMPEEIKNIKQKSGLYLLYSNEGELLYIGKSINLKSRLIRHFKGGSNVEDYIKEFKKIGCYYIDDELELDLCETYLINTLHPKYNKNKYVVNKDLKNKEKRSYKKAQTPPFKKETLVHLRKEKRMTLQQIADELGSTTPSILKYLRYYKIDTDKKIDVMRQQFIKKVKGLKEGEFFKIIDIKKSNSFARHFYNILHENEINKMLKEQNVYRIGSYYYKSNKALSDQEISELRICSKCKKLMHVENFHKTNNKYKSQCKKCRKDRYA